MENKELLMSVIRNIPDYPKPGIQFKDITPLLANPLAFKTATQEMAKPFLDQHIDLVLAVEARGFIFGTSIAQYLNAGFVPVRKPGKLPYQTHSVDYELEYGTDTLEIHQDALKPGQKILIVDDLLATGGTVSGVNQLVKKLNGNIVGFTFLIELEFLKGREKLPDLPIHSVIQY